MGFRRLLSSEGEPGIPRNSSAPGQMDIEAHGNNRPIMRQGSVISGVQPNLKPSSSDTHMAPPSSSSPPRHGFHHSISFTPSMASRTSHHHHDDHSHRHDSSNIAHRIPKDSETTSVLVGKVETLEQPIMAFVRLVEGTYLDDIAEVQLPVRFMFMLMGPSSANLDYHEVGRSISTLMSNQKFHKSAYLADDRNDLLGALNEFLDDTLVLPPGVADKKTLLPVLDDLRKQAADKRRKKREKARLFAKDKEPKDDDFKAIDDPLERTGRCFGGLVRDVKRRYPKYVSDLKDALSFQCIASFVFVYFACLSPAITFGGLMGQKLDGWMGVTEMLFGTCICGLIFHVLAGQPLLIIGATGPVLLFEVALYEISSMMSLDFMAFRFWVCVWVSIVTVILVGLEGSFLVKYITRFTEEIFASLISVIFIYEVFVDMAHTFEKHPLSLTYDPHAPVPDDNESTSSPATLVEVVAREMYTSALPLVEFDSHSPGGADEDEPINQPNTALLSFILTMGTFLFAFFLKKLRNSTFLGRPVRRAIGDFGVPLSIFTMVLIDYFFIKETYIEKLKVPGGLKPTRSAERGWFINPFGVTMPLPVWAIFLASVPAVLVFILLFMEAQITSMIVNKKERQMVKGSGYHLDMFLIGGLALLSGTLGCPLMCAATVRTVTHVSALTVYSRTHAPGEKPSIVEVKEQRITGLLVHVMLGLSTLLGMVLQQVPLPVLFGVFLYMGVASINGIQLFDRVELLFVPVKHHPNVGYVRRVRTWKMHTFTIIQLLCFAVLWVIKSTKASMAFPFVLILMVPFRRFLLPVIFSDQELSQLDRAEEVQQVDQDEDEEGMNESEDEPDFYSQAHMPM